jgi:hypothetical protein
MTVQREEIHAPDAVGSAVVTRIYRAASGGWSVELDLNYTIAIDKHRAVLIRRFVNVTANGQRGRRVNKPQRKTKRMQAKG